MIFNMIFLLESLAMEQKTFIDTYSLPRLLRLASADLSKWKARDYEVEHNVERDGPQRCGDACSQ